MSGKQKGEAHQDQVRQHEDAQGHDEVTVLLRVRLGFPHEFVDDLLVAVLHDKDIVKGHGGEAIDRECEDDRLEPGIKPVMFYEMQIEGFE